MSEEPERLSEREEEILALLADGKSDLEISQELGLSLPAVESLVEGIRAKRALDSSALPRAQRSGEKDALARLSPRDREILELLAEGLASKEIAKKLKPPCAEETVKSHLKNIYVRLGVHSRAAAAAIWARSSKE